MSQTPKIPSREITDEKDYLNRRSFLRRSGFTVAGLAAVGGASGFLAACGSDSKDDSSSSSGSGSKDFGTLDYHLSLIKIVDFSGQYILDRDASMLSASPKWP